MMKEKYGSLIVLTGSMFSGKTEELIRRLNRERYANKSMIIFKPAVDKRFGEDVIQSRALKTTFTAVPVNTPKEANNIMKQYITDNGMDVPDVVAIDEAQFFDMSWVPFINTLITQGSKVIVSGLDMTFQAEPFGKLMPYLMAIANEVHKFRAVCTICGEDAWCSTRISKSRELVDIGDKDKYEARCRDHHYIG